MPTLHWIGKDKVINHHAEVPFRVLEHQYGYRGENPGDNYRYFMVFESKEVEGAITVKQLLQYLNEL